MVTLLSYHTNSACYAGVSPTMTGFQAIFFDFDGVLIDSEPVHWACWREVLLPLGVLLDWEFYRDKCIGIDDREMLRMMAGERDWRELFAEYPKKKELFRARMIQAPPFPGRCRICSKTSKRSIGWPWSARVRATRSSR